MILHTDFHALGLCIVVRLFKRGEHNLTGDARVGSPQLLLNPVVAPAFPEIARDDLLVPRGEQSVDCGQDFRQIRVCFPQIRGQEIRNMVIPAVLAFQDFSLKLRTALRVAMGFSRMGHEGLQAQIIPADGIDGVLRITQIDGIARFVGHKFQRGAVRNLRRRHRVMKGFRRDFRLPLHGIRFRTRGRFLCRGFLNRRSLNWCFLCRRFRYDRLRRVRNPVSLFVKIHIYIRAVHFHDGAFPDERRFGDVGKPRFRKRVQFLPQTGNPSAGSGVYPLIDSEAVLLERQGFQCPLVPVHAERHFRIVHHVAVLDKGMGNGDFVLINPTQMERFVSGFAGNFQTQITVFLIEKIREHLCQRTVVFCRPALALPLFGLLRRGDTDRGRGLRRCPGFLFGRGLLRRILRRCRLLLPWVGPVRAAKFKQFVFSRHIDRSVLQTAENVSGGTAAGLIKGFVGPRMFRPIILGEAHFPV